MSSARERERLRQQALMAALMGATAGPQDDAALSAWMPHPPGRLQRGLQAYQANAGASAERALAAVYPTVQALVGDESFAGLARLHWHTCPPERGDLACWGAGLGDFIAASDPWCELPYLADTARLEWQLAQAERVADEQADLSSLQLLAEADPARLQLELMPGTAVLASDYPVVSLWLAHREDDDAAQHREAARAALARGTGEEALVWREGWRGRVMAVDPPTARWMQALCRGFPLDQAWAAAGDAFAFEPWLAQAVQRGWVSRVRPLA